MDKSKKNGILLILVGFVVVIGAYFLFFSEKRDQTPPQQGTEVAATIPAPADVAAIPGDATVTEDGIGIRFMHDGDGVTFPTLEDDVTLHYTGWQTDGTMFDSSRLGGEPATFPLGRLIEGWKLAVPRMSKGSRALVWIPGALAYDNRPDRPDAPKGMLVFDIELIDIAPSEGQ